MGSGLFSKEDCMNDRELLELAAKAVGLNIKSYAVDTDDNINLKLEEV